MQSYRHRFEPGWMGVCRWPGSSMILVIMTKLEFSDSLCWTIKENRMFIYTQNEKDWETRRFTPALALQCGLMYDVVLVVWLIAIISTILVIYIVARQNKLMRTNRCRGDYGNRSILHMTDSGADWIELSALVCVKGKVSLYQLIKKRDSPACPVT